MLERYLEDLEHEMVRSLSSEDLRDRLAEAETHLRESVEARVELGMAVDEAEREAIEAFGRPLALAKAERPSVWPRLALLLGGYVGGLVTFFVGWWAGSSAFASLLVVGLFLPWSALAIAFALHGYRARRPRPLAVFATGCVASVVVWLTIGTTTVYRAGAGALPKSKVAFARAGRVDQLDRRLGEGDLLRKEVARLDEAGGIESFRGRQGYRVPVPATASRWDVRLSYHEVARADRARSDVRDAWRENAEAVARLREEIAELDEGVAHPARNLVAIAPETVTLNVVAAAVATFVDLLFGGLGVLAFRLRRNRRLPLA